MSTDQPPPTQVQSSADLLVDVFGSNQESVQPEVTTPAPPTYKAPPSRPAPPINGSNLLESDQISMNHLHGNT